MSEGYASGVDMRLGASERHQRPIVDLQPFALPSAFWRVDHLGGAAQAEHVPFVFWLVEAMRPELLVTVGGADGTLYLAQCQAVQRLALEARCHWLADPVDRGKAGAGVANSMSRIREHNERYTAFSRITQAADTDVRQFESASVDFLCIQVDSDGDALRSILEAWRPKLSERGVALVHGINGLKGADGIAAAYAALCDGVRHFEFRHAGGLGLLATGPCPSPLVEYLLEARHQRQLSLGVRNMFWRLGIGCSAAFTSAQAGKKIKSIQAVKATLEKQVEDANVALDEMRHEVVRQKKLFQKAKEQRTELERRLAEQRARSAEQIHMHEKICAGLERMLESQRMEASQALASARAKAKRAEVELSHSRDASTRMKQQLESSQKHLAERTDELQRIVESRSWSLTRPLRVMAEVLRRWFGKA